MEPRRIFEYLRLAPGLVSYLGHHPTLAEAREGVSRRLAARVERFLDLLEHGVYGAPRSPYRKLLLAAGYPWDRVRALASSRGVEETLLELRDGGVFLSAQEWKRRVPIRRPEIELTVAEDAFENPRRGVGGVEGGSSGTTSAGVRVVYDWAFLAEEAENELLLYDCHGLSNVPVALWYPVHVSIAGIHNLLLDLRRGRAPAKWFTQSAERGLRDTAMRWLIAAVARRRGMRSPCPENAPVDDAHRVAAWMQEAIETSGGVVLRTFASSAVRAIQAATVDGIDLRGAAVCVGGEPLGAGGASLMREAGIKAIPRYVSTESGLVAAACPECGEGGEMHVYLDRLAMIPGHDGESLLVTVLTPHAGKVLLNASLGDLGTLSRRPCTCPLGALGLDLFVRDVRSSQSFTQQGMTVEIEELERIVGAMVREAGGAESDFQFWDHPDGGTLSVALSPSLGVVDEARFVSTLMTRLRESGPGGKVAAAVWEGAGALRVVRATPTMTRGQKLKRRIQAP